MLDTNTIARAEDIANWLRNQGQVATLLTGNGKFREAKAKEKEIRAICRIINEAIVDTLGVIDEGEREERAAG